jgi:hypothetical protein
MLDSEQIGPQQHLLAAARSRFDSGQVTVGVLICPMRERVKRNISSPDRRYYGFKPRKAALGGAVLDPGQEHSIRPTCLNRLRLDESD